MANRKRFWNANFTSCIHYFFTKAFNLAFEDNFGMMLPKYNPKTTISLRSGPSAGLGNQPRHSGAGCH